jgi:hypothetical protein
MAASMADEDGRNGTLNPAGEFLSLAHQFQRYGNELAVPVFGPDDHISHDNPFVYSASI